MKRKHKMTGCARFFIAILIIAPLAYFGAAFYNGQDPIENIRNLFGGSDAPRETIDRSRDKQDDEIKKLRDENDALKKKNDQLEKELKNLREGSQ